MKNTPLSDADDRDRPLWPHFVAAGAGTIVGAYLMARWSDHGLDTGWWLSGAMVFGFVAFVWSVLNTAGFWSTITGGRSK